MISFQNFSFRYEESKDFTLRGIDMTVQTGEFILLTGRSGCGKTTLIRSLNGLIPHFYPGEIQGDLVMDGHSLLEMRPSQLAGQVGTVFQDPRSQFFMTDTTRELAFGCENMGLPREETINHIVNSSQRSGAGRLSKSEHLCPIQRRETAGRYRLSLCSFAKSIHFR